MRNTIRVSYSVDSYKVGQNDLKSRLQRTTIFATSFLFFDKNKV